MIFCNIWFELKPNRLFLLTVYEVNLFYASLYLIFKSNAFLLLRSVRMRNLALFVNSDVFELTLGISCYYIEKAKQLYNQYMNVSMSMLE